MNRNLNTNKYFSPVGPADGTKPKPKQQEAKFGGNKQDRQPNEGIYRNPRFMNANNTVLGCPLLLKVKSNDTCHGTFVKFSSEFDVLLESCHKVDPKHEVLIYGRSLPRKSEVCARFFERENIVEMTACYVDKDFALKSFLKSIHFIKIFYLKLFFND